MDSRDRDAISDLFRKLRDVEHQAGPRDAEAERLIADETQRLPGASYYMAQTIVMQDMALNAKQRELDDLKRQVERGDADRERAGEGGGFLSRMFGGNNERPDDRSGAPGRGGPWGGSQQGAPQQGYAQQQSPQYAQPPQYAPQQGGFGRGFGGGGGGGFLAGAAQTAMGVAGGVVLGNAIGSMFGGHGGLFGGSEQPQEVVNETTNIYEGDQGNDVRDASDQGGYGDDNAGDSGFQDASYDDGGDAGFDDGGDMGGVEDV